MRSPAVFIGMHIFLLSVFLRYRYCRLVPFARGSLFNVDRQNEPLLDATGPHKCSTVNGLVAMEAVLNSNTDIQPFVNQTLMISRLMASAIFSISVVSIVLHL